MLAASYMSNIMRRMALNIMYQQSTGDEHSGDEQDGISGKRLRYDMQHQRHPRYHQQQPWEQQRQQQQHQETVSENASKMYKYETVHPRLQDDYVKQGRSFG